MISRLRSLLSAAIAFALVLGLGVGTANAATVEVKLGTDSGMLAFEPSTLNIKAGDTVKLRGSPKAQTTAARRKTECSSRYNGLWMVKTFEIQTSIPGVLFRL